MQAPSAPAGAGEEKKERVCVPSLYGLSAEGGPSADSTRSYKPLPLRGKEGGRTGMMA